MAFLILYSRAAGTRLISAYRAEKLSNFGNIKARFVKFCRQRLLRNRHPHRISYALPQRAGGGFMAYPGTTLYSLEKALKPLGREPHSVIEINVSIIQLNWSNILNDTS